MTSYTGSGDNGNNINKMFSYLVGGLWARMRSRSNPVSMVLLLRKPTFLSQEQLSAIVEQAWGALLIERVSDHFVTQSEDKSVVYVKPHMISLMNSSRPYLNVDPSDMQKHFLK